MAAVGPGGTVLGQAHTRPHARDAVRTTIMNRAPYETWRGQGARDMAAAAPRRVEELLAGYAPPEDLDATVRRQLDAYCLG